MRRFHFEEVHVAACLEQCILPVVETVTVRDETSSIQLALLVRLRQLAAQLGAFEISFL